MSLEAELCAKMLAFEATERPSAEEALTHVPLKNTKRKKDEKNAKIVEFNEGDQTARLQGMSLNIWHV